MTINSPLFKTIGNTIKKPILKTIDNTMKKSVGVFYRKKCTIKNLASGLEKRYLGIKHNFGNQSIKHFREN